MAWTRLVSMEMDDEDKIDFCAPIACEAPDYPYGLRITLSEKELKKLELPLPEIGDYLDLRAFARVTSVSLDQRNGEDCCRVELQIEQIAVENENTEEDD